MRDVGYLLTLKRIARSLGVDVPFYTMTGWSGRIPQEGLLPLTGAYADGYWSPDAEPFRGAYLFPAGTVSAPTDMGAIDKPALPVGKPQPHCFPHLCCESGGGMVSCYNRRVDVSPQDTAALAIVALGTGNNMPGYYVYQGGINPGGKYSTFNEPGLPVKDYDFEAPLGACGQVREHYRLLRLQHLFLEQFGESLAVMRPFHPDRWPANADDDATLRWNVRSDGHRGFFFFCNHEHVRKLPAKEDVQFSLKTKDETLLVPRDPIAIPSGTYGIWPINLDCGGVTVKYATAQPICSVETDGQCWFFFTAIEGIQPDFVVSDSGGHGRFQNIVPGTAVAFTRQAASGRKVNFIVLTVEQAAACGSSNLPDGSVLPCRPTPFCPIRTAISVSKRSGRNLSSLRCFRPSKPHRSMVIR